MPIDPFDSPFLLLDRARENREELNARAKAFFDAHPYALFVDRDPDTAHYFRKIKFTSDLPQGLWSVAADALNNLRNALDQGVCASVVALTPSVSLDQVFFPFADSKSHFEKSVARLTAKVHPRVIAVLGFFQPYKGGNDRLWALKNLTNANKHRSLVSFGAAVDNIEVNTLELPGPGPILKPYWDRAKNEIVISRTVDNVEPRYDLDVSFHISFGDIEGLSGKPVVEAIDYLSAIVSAFLTGLQSDMRSILAGNSL
ncbi:MAG: hypothetical protein ACLPOA_08970 [Methylocella sp.]|jgi:hypothetical protein